MHVAIYSRKSVETDTGESIKNQIIFCKQYFERQENCTFEIFEDEGFSGSTTNRPAFQRMMELVKFKQFDAVAVYKIDRIARNIVDFVNIYNELENMNVQLVSVTEGFDPSTPVGKMMMLLLASFAEMERMNIAQRVKDNMKELAKLGRWSGGTPPTGYITKKVTENGKKVTYLELTDEGENIKKMFEMYAAGYTTFQINKHFNSMGLNYPIKTIQNIITNPTYLKSSKESIECLTHEGYLVFGTANGCGFLPYNRRPKIKGKKTWKDKSKFVGISKHEGIIDIDLWMAVQDKIKEKSVDPHPRESNFSYLSGGLMKCTCGNSMMINPGHRKKDGSRYYYFICKNSDCSNKSIRTDRAEDEFKNFLSVLLDDQLLEQYSEKNKSEKDIEKEIKAINKKIQTNNKAIDSLVDKLILLSHEAAKSLTNKIEELTSQNTSLQEQLLYLQREQIFSKEDNDNIDTMYDLIKSFLNNDMSVEDRKTLVKTIVEYIIWDSESGKMKVKLRI